MSGCLALDETMPALTSRLLLLLEDDEDVLVLKPQSTSTRTSGMALSSRLEETKEESPMLVSPMSSTNAKHNKHRQQQQQQQQTQWSCAPFAIPECGLPSIPSCPLPMIPTTPRSATKGLFSPLSPMPQDLWQYGQTTRNYFVSPRTTDAVLEEKKQKFEAVWYSPNANKSKNRAAMIPNLPPMAPSLLPQFDDMPAANNNHSNHHHKRDSPPTFILYRNRSASFCSSAIDDDEVSLLADDPDEDDAGVLPPATYDVVVNILDEIDRDEGKARITG
eukprot:CAMPEP_0116131552 /NCGR_PEP_ID=MMETSP0329-20121206/9070_1 /TAXON_ID=697910 /ORGANISM="Pseudo-nitzschia arenysensis, Strain B593" /LENGTH=275 /DNA_ID=CAMNT_0003625997 /DNA_START=609 /DNA_END=1436 /DNA_ORIENTATION=+